MTQNGGQCEILAPRVQHFIAELFVRLVLKAVQTKALNGNSFCLEASENLCEKTV